MKRSTVDTHMNADCPSNIATTVLRVETNIITVNPIGRTVILVIMYVETFTNCDIVFSILNVVM